MPFTHRSTAHLAGLLAQPGASPGTWPPPAGPQLRPPTFCGSGFAPSYRGPHGRHGVCATCGQGGLRLNAHVNRLLTHAPYPVLRNEAVPVAPPAPGGSR